MPTVPTAITATAATASLANVLMVGNLHGTREARRCGIEGNAARTVASTARRRDVGIGLEPVRDAGLEVGIDGRSAHAGRSSDVTRERPSSSSTARS